MTGPATDRLAELDVLRGVALFGVFLVNMVEFAGDGLMATEQQLQSLPTAALDHTLTELIEWLVVDKANTLFAFLFGLGFYLQMQRLGARGADFDRIYLRRLTFLLVFGLLHNFLVWSWDILHLYALVGFVLFAMRRVRDRTLLVGGILLALLPRPAKQLANEFGGLDTWHGWPNPFSDEAVLARQQLSANGDYAGLFRAFAEMTYVDYILGGVLVGWFLYVLGRFMLGAWVGRRGWLQRSAEFLPGFRRVLRIALPAGLLGECIAGFIDQQADGWEVVAGVVHLFAVPVLAAGYVSAIVLAVHHRGWQRLMLPFAYVGRMALTNYVAQSAVLGFVLFGVGPGLALAGHIGTAAVTLIVIVGFAAQVLYSRWWLARFRFGPLEWAWRAFTYRELPAGRIEAA
jgi:uncharacterized protein